MLENGEASRSSRRALLGLAQGCLTLRPETSSRIRSLTTARSSQGDWTASLRCGAAKHEGFKKGRLTLQKALEARGQVDLLRCPLPAAVSQVGHCQLLPGRCVQAATRAGRCERPGLQGLGGDFVRAVEPPLLRWHWVPALHPRWQIRHRGKRQADGSKCSFESEPCLTLLPGVIQRKTFWCCCLFVACAL